MKRIISIFATVLLSALGYSLSAQTVYIAPADSNVTATVYAITDSTMADLFVFQASSGTNVGPNNGIWYFTADAASASKKVFFTGNVNDAEIWIYYTTVQENAGWKNIAKTVLLN